MFEKGHPVTTFTTTFETGPVFESHPWCLCCIFVDVNVNRISHGLINYIDTKAKRRHLKIDL
jgi:hypothetical protein